MFYVALDTVEHHIERVMRRAARGGRRYPTRVEVQDGVY
jgi:predicted ABC-type ATPase